jgi:hypothetical protein
MKVLFFILGNIIGFTASIFFFNEYSRIHSYYNLEQVLTSEIENHCYLLPSEKEINSCLEIANETFDAIAPATILCMKDYVIPLNGVSPCLKSVLLKLIN